MDVSFVRVRAFGSVLSASLLVGLALVASSCGGDSIVDPKSPENPSPSPKIAKPLRIVFEVPHPFGWARAVDIYSVDSAGNDRVLLTPDSASSSCPAVSPAGDRIAYYRRDMVALGNPLTLTVMNSDGSGKTNVLATIGNTNCPKWSPDGALLGFLENVSSSSQTKLLHILGPDLKEIRSILITDGSRFDFSKDHSLVAFTSFTGIQVAGTAGGAAPAFVAYGGSPSWVSATRLVYDDSGISSIVVGGAPASVLAATGGEPVASPSGDRIAFKCGNVLCAMSSSGGTISTLSQFNFVYYNDVFSWSSDGSMIVGTCRGVQRGVCVVNHDGSGWQDLSAQTTGANYAGFAR